MPEPIPPLPEAERSQIERDIEKLYGEVAADLSLLPMDCTACGACCDFGRSEHRLYASTLEFLHLLAKYPVPPAPEGRDACPFLRENRCSARDRRMLGCRTYFRLHGKEDRIAAEEIYERHLSALKRLHEKYGIEWNYRDCMSVFRPSEL